MKRLAEMDRSTPKDLFIGLWAFGMTLKIAGWGLDAAGIEFDAPGWLDAAYAFGLGVPWVASGLLWFALYVRDKLRERGGRVQPSA